MPTTDAERGEVDAVLDGEPEEHARLLVRAREAELRSLSRRHRRDVLTEELDGSGRRVEVARDDVEERGLSGPVRAENGMTRTVLDVEIDSGHGDETAEAPADPPQAESRRGVRSGRWSFAHSSYLIDVFVITPFLTTLSFPCHGVLSFLHGGWERPGGGLDGLKRPPNDWSTAGMYAMTVAPTDPSWFLTSWSWYWSWIAWRRESSLTFPPFEIWNGASIDRGSEAWSLRPTAPPDFCRPCTRAFADM